ncbi:protein-L-isoaspartate(D-aspartate) O-methyltransferase [Photobacterium piscicola]|uniref:Protein-L-isoaspartate O-methyltransferase n=1 Tax=Photobacterium piscicola TaxID=1378299 RepID=A0ABU6LL39_9GAMM|nr:protein-L-isoaspartate(D-aspartate) O-methyltransferase [Photobacterium piscicola]MEC6883874.1 protein-L-isoaspartate(D-aspartate) O-methyltransferase [Photobacterium piscicola]MEC6900053.1 protein-L-isoaspartate(D-aspartate) O-methyltransferase [Photobacterium piscicola]
MRYQRKVDNLIALLVTRGITDQRVLRAIAAIPREFFVDEAFSYQAYENNALPIGSGQTISQPYIVAKMTSLLALTAQSSVLEIGTGSGYQASVLAQLADHVYSVERIKSLQWQAKRRFKQLELYNISTKHGDGWLGWESKGPFDAIIVTAAPSEVPQSLLTQLADGGRLILPVGYSEQVLRLIVRNGDQFIETDIEPVKFVPLVAGDLA